MFRQCRWIPCPDAIPVRDLIQERRNRISLTVICDGNMYDVDSQGNLGALIPANSLIFLDIKKGCQSAFRWCNPGVTGNTIMITEMLETVGENIP
jgi:hypothetical protein